MQWRTKRAGGSVILFDGTEVTVYQHRLIQWHGGSQGFTVCYYGHGGTSTVPALNVQRSNIYPWKALDHGFYTVFIYLSVICCLFLFIQRRSTKHASSHSPLAEEVSNSDSFSDFHHGQPASKINYPSAFTLKQTVVSNGGGINHRLYMKMNDMTASLK